MARAREQIITRFAPSPTGLLHLGHLYAALFACDLAAKHGGRFLLRYEDIDITRIREHFYTQIEEDLAWAGLTWETPTLRQTTRTAAYSDALEKLKSLGVIYPCFCTRKDIQRELKSITRAPHGPDGPHYPQTCKKLTLPEIQQRLDDRLEPSWRLDSARAKELTGDLTFTDALHGQINVDHTLLGDLILARKDIGTSYHIAVVVDDAFQNITDVTRGKDLLESTHIHRVLQVLLALPEPKYHHHKLVCDNDAERLTKRNAALSIQSLREQEISKESLIELAHSQLR